MSTKSFIWLGLMVFSTIGGFLPFLWGGGMFSSIIFSTIGGIFGIWLGYKISQ